MEYSLYIARELTTIIVALVTIAVAILVFLRRGKINLGKINIDFDQKIEAEAERVRARISSHSEQDQYTVDKQYLLHREYHVQGLAQSKISFWFSLVFAMIGFLVIIVAILTIDKNATFAEQGNSFITLFAGIIIDAVSALFFVQSNKSRQLMTDFFDRLRIDRKLDESLQLADNIPDERIQSKLKVLLSLNFADVNMKDELLAPFFNFKNETEDI